MRTKTTFCLSLTDDRNFVKNMTRRDWTSGQLSQTRKEVGEHTVRSSIGCGIQNACLPGLACLEALDDAGASLVMGVKAPALAANNFRFERSS
jgi:hypothetical protein